MRKLRAQFWAEIGLALTTAILAVVTAIWSDWIEIVFDVDPDGGNGSLEWLIVLALAGATVVFAALARREWAVAAA